MAEMSGSSSSSSSRFAKGNEGDWICEDPECENLNFARRESCNKCGKDKPDIASLKKLIGTEIGKAAAEKSRGLFSADDWQCSKCGNVNWARRHQCNMCNAPKVGEVEERTGYGGGYNDRGTVEYVERQESDDEYDEFGRKRKRPRRHSDLNEPKSGNNGLAKEEKKDYLEAEDDEEDDDEEDDDDEDLSKYDLSGWGEDEDK